jgi:SAM-dependent methyltransferase
LTIQLAHYQERALRRFVKALPSNPAIVLEVGSDLQGHVVQKIATFVDCQVVGINPAPTFPQLPQAHELPDRIRLTRTDGRTIPLPDNSVDGIFTVATVEHIIEIDRFYAEVYRVLKPGGVLFADFAPIWPSYNGHHTYAVTGEKEARYWKPGRNPVPDFAHLLWTPEEMREFLHRGPCDEALVDPIVDWVYSGDGINRVFLEEHLRALKCSGLLCQRLRLKPGVRPEPETEAKLLSRYGSDRRFDVAGVEATMRKRQGPADTYVITSRRIASGLGGAFVDLARSFSPVLRRSRTLRLLLNRRNLREVAKS